MMLTLFLSLLLIAIIASAALKALPSRLYRTRGRIQLITSPSSPSSPPSRLSSSVDLSSSSTAHVVIDDLSFQSFVEEITSSLKRERFIGVSLTKPSREDTSRAGTMGDLFLISITGRLVSLKAGLRCQLTFKYNTNEQVKNFDVDNAATNEIVKQILSNKFSKAQLVTSSKKFTLGISHTTGLCKLGMVEEEAAVPDVASLAHDRQKVRPVDTNASFLRELRVTTSSGRPLAGMADKLRQIERFVEILSGLVESSTTLAPKVKTHGGNGDPLRIVDMGSGMGYLTFAAHSYFQGSLSGTVVTVGVEARAQLVEQCTATARRLGDKFDGLSFEKGSIEDSAWSNGGGQGVDVLIALHACDTATDDAIFCGITSGASVIVTSPCCHKELRRQMDKNINKVAASSTQELLSHGLFRERSAEMVTDCLRVICLNSAGYDTTVLEFVDGQHTAKNVMIAATKRATGSNNDAERGSCKERIAALMGSYGVETQALVRRMGITAATDKPALKPLRSRTSSIEER